MRNADFLIGNSSSGIVEVASFKLAAINIGERQRGRLHGENVIFVDNNRLQIKEAIQKVLFDIQFKEDLRKSTNPYGLGNSAEKIVEVLTKIELNNTLIHKNISY